MGRSSYRHVILSAVAVYTFLALATDIFDQKEPKKDVFKLEKLPLRPGEEIQMVAYTQRKARVKEVCSLWGAYNTKPRFMKFVQKETGVKTKDEILKDKMDLSQAQLERIWQLNKRTTFHQMFVDRDHSLTWCKVPKAASTSWLHAFLEIAGEKDVSSKDMAGKHALLRERYPMLTNSLLKRIMPTTLKFMVVRHPFERALSAYRDKLEDYARDLKDRGGYYYAIYGKKIVKAYRKEGTSGEDSNQHREPTFREFIQYLLDTDVEEYDEHWRPISLLCTPCHIKYDVIAKMETLSKDADFILYHRGLADNVHIEWSHKTDQLQKTSDVARTYFSQLTSSEVKQLYHKYLLDFLMFEYDLEPYVKLTQTQKINTTLTIDGNEGEEEYYNEDDEEYSEDNDDEDEEEEVEYEEEETPNTGDHNYEEYAVNDKIGEVDNNI